MNDAGHSTCLSKELSALHDIGSDNPPTLPNYRSRIGLQTTQHEVSVEFNVNCIITLCCWLVKWNDGLCIVVVKQPRHSLVNVKLVNALFTSSRFGSQLKVMITLVYCCCISRTVELLT
jgi:hypothetical protein